MSWSSRRGQARGRFSRPGGYYSTKPSNTYSSSPAPPLGDLLETISREEISRELSAVHEHCGITDVEFVASYNWLNEKQPKILIPGKPPVWTPPKTPPMLDQDGGVYFRDPNAASYPKHPTDPVVMSVMKMQPKAAAHVDIFACSSTLGNLLRFVQKKERSFRILVECIGDTVHLIRRENSPTETIDDVKGHGHTFPEAYTTWESDAKNSKSHQRIIKYRFAGLDMMVRFAGDGYIATPSSPSVTPAPQGSEDQPPSINSLDDLADKLTLKSEHDPAGDGELEIISGGQVISHNDIFDLKTRSIWGRDKVNVLVQELPRFWVAQTKNFILAYHENGLFEEKDITIKNIEKEVSAWEDENEQDLKRLARLLRTISKTCKQRDTKIEIVRVEDGPLEIRERLSDAGEVFSEDVRSRWTAWLAETAKSGSEQESYDSDDYPYDASYYDDYDRYSYGYGDSDREDPDYTACSSSDCGFCGKCPY